MLETIPPLLLQFLLTTAFSLLVGLQVHSYLKINQYSYGFGSTRTFMLIGMLGFLLYQLDEGGVLFVTGFILLGSILSVYYWRQTSEKNYSLLEVILALLVFLIGPVIQHFPLWFLVLFVVLLVLMLGEQPRIRQFSESLASNELVTLAKFLIISGVILPLLPDKQIAAMLPVTYYKVWLAVIVVSGVSYLSYIAQTYFFKVRGLLLTGLLGGLYSSTATTVVISRRAKKMPDDRSNVSASLILATAMMYLRLLGIVYFMHPSIGQSLLLPFSVLIMLSCLAAGSLLYLGSNGALKQPIETAQHPLELSTALLFAAMFVFFAFVTNYVVGNYGHNGLNFLSIIVGFTDIDPFILSLLSGKFAVSEQAVVTSIIIASGSNNLLKAIYAALLARNRSILAAAMWLLFLLVVSLGYTFLLI